MGNSIGERRRVDLPEQVFQRIVNYSRDFGLPLIEPNRQRRRRDRIYAISRGLSQPFTIVSRTELELTGPRQWHFEWTLQMIDAGRVPTGYQDQFPEHDVDDLLAYLREIDREWQLRLYAQAYSGEPMLSFRRIKAWLNEEIDLSATDFDRAALVKSIRTRNAQSRVAFGSLAGSRITWTCKESGELAGYVARQKLKEGEGEDFHVSGPAALACLQWYWDETGIPLEIEPIYLNDG